MEGVPKLKKMGAALLPRRRLADKFLHGARAPAIFYQYVKFQLPSSISSGYIGVLKYTLGAAVSYTRPIADNFFYTER